MDRAASPHVSATSAGQDDPDLELVAAELDVAFYRAAYPDIDVPEIDPAAHFHDHGWRERRAPNAWFDTGYYLNAYPDIRAAGIDPLVHYLRHGQSEGRLPARPGGWRRRLIAEATPPAGRPIGYDAPRDAPEWDAAGLGRRLEAACDGAGGLVLSFSHDRYTDITGGIQLMIADEQGMFNGNRLIYLHVAPAIARMTLAPEEPGPQTLQLTLDGRVLGLATDQALAEALARLPDGHAPTRLLVVHSLFGHRVTGILALAAALRPSRHVFWLHDYASLCEGYTLLRNDAAFCGAPPVDSMACRVCVYGEGRAAHRAAVRDLFARIGFHVVAPSRVALDLWRAAADLPYLSVRVHANCLLLPAALPAPAPVRTGPPRVAFAGYPLGHKGWGVFVDLVHGLRAQARRGGETFALHHFASPDALQPMDGLRSVAVRTDRHDRHAMSAALAAHAIDLVVMLSPWPETFSYVAHEALAAGADIVTLQGCGNVAALVRRLGRGAVLDDAQALADFFKGGDACAYVLARRAGAARPGVLHLLGGTATLDLEADDGPEPDRLHSDDPALRVIADGREIKPERDGQIWRFALPAGSGTLRLVSRSVVPAALRSDTTDHRRLGVAIRHLALDGVAVPPGHARRVFGWHSPQAEWQWTSGDAVLEADGARRLEIVLEPLLSYIVSPLAAAS